MCAARKLFWAHYNFETPASGGGLEKEYLQAMEDWKEGCGISGSRWEVMERDLACGNLFPQDRVWVLRNLTTRELVSTKKTTTMKMKTRSIAKSALNLQGLKLDDLLLMKICWTSIPSYGPDEKLGVHRGSWAGHRFDIVTLDVHQAEEKDSKWRDVTEEATKEARKLRQKVERLMKEGEMSDIDEDDEL
jgi:hypothetical protein